MGGWKLEAGKFFMYVTFPVASFWAFNQPFFYNSALQFYEKAKPDLKYTNYNREQIVEWKEELRESRKQAEFEKILREKMAFEEARRFREENKI